MPIGPGKYDDVCTLAREKAEASGMILIVLNGKFGHGFSCQLSMNDMLNVPKILRNVANDIEKSIPNDIIKHLAD